MAYPRAHNTIYTGIRILQAGPVDEEHGLVGPHLRHPRAYTSYITDFTHVTNVTDSNSEASPVDTNNQPAKNSEGRVIEWITQYLRDRHRYRRTCQSSRKWPRDCIRISRPQRLRLVRAVLAGDPDPPVWRPRQQLLRQSYLQLRVHPGLIRRSMNSYYRSRTDCSSRTSH